MSRDNVLFATCGLLLGFIVGFFVAGGGRPAPLASGAAPGSSAEGSARDPAALSRLERIRTALGADPENVDLQLELANQYYDTGDWRNALGWYEKVLARKADDPDVLTDYANCLRNTGDFNKAIRTYELAQKIHSEHWQSALNLALVYAYDKSDPRKAQEALDHLTALWAALQSDHPDLPPLPQLSDIEARIATLRMRS